jgi:protein SCO1/2
MRETLVRGWIILTICWISPTTTFAQRVEPLPTALEGVGVDEHPGSIPPLDLGFRDHHAKPVKLGDFFHRGRPVILTLNYSNCPMLCNLQLSGLVEGLRGIDWNAGTEFDVVSVSIDPLETPERAAVTQQRYLQHYGRPGTGDGWHFLVGRPAEIDALAQSIGFEYRYIRERREYSHPAVFVICTPDGRIARYVYGIEFPPRTLELSLVEAAEGKLGTTWDRFLLYCLHYDSTSGRYTPAAWKLMRLAGVTTLLAVGGLVVVLRRREWRSRIINPNLPLAVPDNGPLPNPTG